MTALRSTLGPVLCRLPSDRKTKRFLIFKFLFGELRRVFKLSEGAFGITRISLFRA